MAGGMVHVRAERADHARKSLAGGRTFENGAITGTTWHAGADRATWRSSRGRFFRADEDRSGDQVAVIGADVADALFPAEDPLGRSIRVAGRRFR